MSEWVVSEIFVTGRLPGLVTAVKSDGDVEVAGLAFLTGDQETGFCANPKALTLKSKGQSCLRLNSAWMSVKPSV